MEKPDLSSVGVDPRELMQMITNLQVENMILKKQVAVLEAAFDTPKPKTEPKTKPKKVEAI